MRKSKFLVAGIVLLLAVMVTDSVYAQIAAPQKGRCSYYGKKFHGRRTASGERYNMYELTAAHRTLDFGTIVNVINLDNGKSVTVRINDRGPFKSSRILDVSREAAKQLDMIEAGVANVHMEVMLDSEPIIISEDEISDPGAKSEIGKSPMQETGADNYATGKSYSLWGTVKNPQGVGIQVASFNDIHNAKVFVKQLHEAGFEDIFIVSLGNGRNELYRIIAGSFEDRDEAKDYQKDLRKAGFNGFIKTHGQE